jgi:hypothetical protein
MDRWYAQFTLWNDIVAVTPSDGVLRIATNVLDVPVSIDQPVDRPKADPAQL